jgi:hypothetical protein
VVKVSVGSSPEVIADAIASVAPGSTRRAESVSAARAYAAAHSVARVSRLLADPATAL